MIDSRPIVNTIGSITLKTILRAASVISTASNLFGALPKIGWPDRYPRRQVPAPPQRIRMALESPP
jgi:hypothetical protein